MIEIYSQLTKNDSKRGYTMDTNDINKDGKWEFEDYAFTMTGILVGVLIVVPELLYNYLGISILGGGIDYASQELFEGMSGGYGIRDWNLNELRFLSPMLFLMTITVCMFKDAIDARKTGGYTSSVFTHTFESLFEDAIYMGITTIMVYSAVFFGAMYASWMTGPIAWILFVFILPLVKKDNDNTDEKTNMPWILLFIFIAGIVVEVITREWIAFPVSWLIICVLKLIEILKEKAVSTNAVFDILYYAFSVVLLAVGVTLDFWMVSWAAFPIALFVCWVMSKFRRFKKKEENS